MQSIEESGMRGRGQVVIRDIGNGFYLMDSLSAEQRKYRINPSQGWCSCPSKAPVDKHLVIVRRIEWIRSSRPGYANLVTRDEQERNYLELALRVFAPFRRSEKPADTQRLLDECRHNRRLVGAQLVEAALTRHRRALGPKPLHEEEGAPCTA